ncbi:MAG: ABC transporter ATP-binding protein [Methanolinea sp.]
MRLEVENLSFSYGERQVLIGIDLAVRDGEIVGVLGPNGSGKTTLIKCIDYILAPVGKVTLDGKDVSSMGPVERARLIAYVPQAFSVGMAMTVFEAVLMGRRPYVSWAVADRDIEVVTSTMESLGLQDLAFRKVTQISGGERQKVTIARALVQEPALLLLDEPTSALDLRHQLEIMAILRSRAKKGEMGVLMAIHDLNIAARCCDRVVLLKDGRISGEGPPEEILTGETIRDVYGVRVATAKVDGIPVIVPVEPVGA